MRVMETTLSWPVEDLVLRVRGWQRTVQICYTSPRLMVITGRVSR